MPVETNTSQLLKAARAGAILIDARLHIQSRRTTQTCGLYQMVLAPGAAMMSQTLLEISQLRSVQREFALA